MNYYTEKSIFLSKKKESNLNNKKFNLEEKADHIAIINRGFVQEHSEISIGRPLNKKELESVYVLFTRFYDKNVSDIIMDGLNNIIEKVTGEEVIQ